MEVFRLLKLLQYKFPKAYICIDTECTVSPRTKGVKHEYMLYIKHDNNEKVMESFEYFRELREFIHKLTGTLTVSRILNWRD